MKEFTNNLFFSVILHALILAALVINFTSRFSVPGTAQIIPAYLAKPSQKLIHQNAEKTAPQGLIQISSAENNTNSPTQKSTAQTQAISGDHINHLIALIYQAISQHQIYPEDLQLTKNAKVVIAFILDPNGAIKAVRIAQSSGNTRLDQAAVLAVNEAQPINGVAPYLKSTQDFAIPIVYRAKN